MSKKRQRVGLYFSNIMNQAEANIREVPPPPALTTQQFIDLGRVPDFVRDVKTFSGDPTKLIDWITDVEAIFRTYRDSGATQTQLNVLERTIRRKIDGEAADILNSNNISSSWADIKTTLVLYYRDQRDIKTLDYQLTSIKKTPDESLSTYYSRVTELLSLMIAQVQTDEKLKENAAAHIDYFRDKALDAFIRGLDKPLSILLKSTNPRTLGQAFNFCVEYHNMDIRTAPFRNEFGNHSTPKPREPPKLPPRPQSMQPRPFIPPPPPPRRPNFFQNYALPPKPIPQTNPFRPNPQNAFRPFQNNPFRSFQNTPFGTPKPEPMELDSSGQTRMINYGNRPVMNLKRSHPPSLQQHQAFKRQAHPLEASYANPEYYGYPDYDYDYGYEQYWDETQYDGSYEQSEQAAHDQPEQAALIEVNDQDRNNAQETNFLEWHPSW